MRWRLAVSTISSGDRVSSGPSGLILCARATLRQVELRPHRSTKHDQLLRHTRAGSIIHEKHCLTTYVILAKDSQGSPIQLHRELILLGLAKRTEFIHVSSIPYTRHPAEFQAAIKVKQAGSAQPCARQIPRRRASGLSRWQAIFRQDRWQSVR